MPKIEITLPDGSKKKVDKGSTIADLASSIGEGLARAALAGKVNGEPADLAFKLEKSAKVEIITFKSPAGPSIFWHSTAHVFAHALLRVFPKAKIAIGPPVEGGFYYDFELDHFEEADLEKVEAEMKKIISEDLPSKRYELSRKEALAKFKSNPYKVEMIKEMPESEKITAYDMGPKFFDLCRGPHVPRTGLIKALKLTKLAGAYWRGNSENKMLYRVYGVSFPDKKDLKAHLELLEEAEKRDHRKLGTQLDLYSFHEEAPGMPFFHQKGTIIYNHLIEYKRELMRKYGYEETRTPLILNNSLWKQSGHWDHYQENMYFVEIDDAAYAVKPMNCPGSTLIYRSQSRSYRDLPLRLGEFGYVHRHELSGVIHGLMRVRGFVQDDAHIYVTPEQIESEIQNQIALYQELYSTFGFEYRVVLSTKPEKAMGSDALWKTAEAALDSALKEKKINFEIAPGDGAFYGPKIDFILKDVIGREWQCGTIQLDFQMPERFDLEYIGEDNKPHRPVMIHPAAMGSVERFFGILVEHYAGDFPLWLAPVQIKLLPIADRHAKHAGKLKAEFDAQGLRAEIDASQNKVEYKIRAAQLEKVPFTLVIGDKEIEENMVTIRDRKNKVWSEKTEKFLESMTKQVQAHK